VRARSFPSHYRAVLSTAYLLFLFSKQPLYGKALPKDYQEDLSRHRMVWSDTLGIPTCKPLKPLSTKPAMPLETGDIALPLQELLDTLKEAYQKVSTIPGYTVQAYMGTSRQRAFQIKEMILEQYPFLDPTLYYNQPNFVVHVGRFLERIEAYPLYFMIKKVVPQAITRPEVFPNQQGIFLPWFVIPPSSEDMPAEAEKEEEKLVAKEDNYQG
jgi:hypothetical protein